MLQHLLFNEKAVHNIDNKRLKSSLQYFESSLYLIAHQRFPHALLELFISLEIALRKDEEKVKRGLEKQYREKGKKGKKYRKNIQLWEYIEYTFDDFDSEEFGLDKDEFTNLRLYRNDIVHKGVSPDDDAQSIKYYFTEGLNYYEAILLQYYSKELEKFLTGDFWNAIKKTRELLTPVDAKVNNVEFIRYYIRNAIRSLEPSELIDSIIYEETDNQLFDYKQKIKESIPFLVDIWLDCPVCDDFDTLGSELYFETAKPFVKQCICIYCSFCLSPIHKELMESLLRDQLNAEENIDIIKGFI